MNGPDYDRLADEFMGRANIAVEVAMSEAATRQSMRALVAAAIADGYMRGMQRAYERQAGL